MVVRWCGWSALLLASAILVFSEETPPDEDLSTTTEHPLPETCFHRPPSYCPDERDQCRCRRLPDDPQAVVCCNITKAFLLKESLACLTEQCDSDVECPKHVLKIHIYNATLEEFNITSEQPNLRRVVSMSLTNGRIDKVVGAFAKHTSISCLNLSTNGLNEVDKRSFVYLHNLTMLDLSHNNLSEVPNFNKKRLIALDISDNRPLLCRSLMDAMNNTELDFVREKDTYCLFPKTFNWFNTTEYIPLRQVISYTDLEKKSCSDNCSCKVLRLDLVEGKPPAFAVMVDCSGKQLTEMPSNLPPNTIALNISNNNITVLKMDGDTYENIRELDADSNQITSILSLEGTKFLENFVALSLRNNRLKTLPTYMLSHIFDRNSLKRQVALSLNHFHCDCAAAKILKVWLLTKQKNVPDYDEISCENLPLKVIHLNQADVCQPQNRQDWTDYIYYIITAEVLLLVCLIIKVSYDYWVFKTAGYLPWPASKMPKLPCDWLCE